MNTEHLDALESRSADERAAAWAEQLPALVAAAQALPAGAALAGVDPALITRPADLAGLPLTRKSDVLAAQQAARAQGGNPFGGHAALGWNRHPGLRPARRVFQSPGPLYEAEGSGPDYWRLSRALFAAGLRAGQLVHNSFSYHLTPAGSMMEGGALALGCSVFPGGVGQTELQLQAIQDLRPDAYAGTPSFLRILAEKADAAGADISSLRHALVSGEAFPAALREGLQARGIAAYQCYATADVGLIAYETAAREGLVVDEAVCLEIVRPGSGEVLPAGEVGEVVVTVLNLDYPLLRLATGDLSAVLPGPCPTGRSHTRIRGWLGRADQTAKVRGMFVQPAQLAAVLARHPEVTKARLVVEGEMANDVLTLHAECARAPEGLVAALALSVRELTRLRAEVLLCAVGSLPNDGKVIDDRRSSA